MRRLNDVRRACGEAKLDRAAEAPAFRPEAEADGDLSRAGDVGARRGCASFPKSGVSSDGPCKTRRG